MVHAWYMCMCMCMCMCMAHTWSNRPPDAPPSTGIGVAVVSSSGAEPAADGPRRPLACLSRPRTAALLGSRGSHGPVRPRSAALDLRGTSEEEQCPCGVITGRKYHCVRMLWVFPPWPRRGATRSYSAPVCSLSPTASIAPAKPTQPRSARCAYTGVNARGRRCDVGVAIGR